MKRWIMALLALALSSPVMAFEDTALTTGSNVATEGHDDGILGTTPITISSSYVSDTIDLDSVKEDLQAVADKTPHAQGLCNLAAVAFSNLTFQQRGNAQSKCDELTAQVNNANATCKVVKLNNGRFRAQFRLNFQQNNQVLNQLLGALVNFILTNNIFSNAQIAVQSAVSNGCG